MHNKLSTGAVCYALFPKFAKSGGRGHFPPGPPAGNGSEGESFVLTHTQCRVGNISVFQPLGQRPPDVKSLQDLKF